jgi:hypothetical protein
MMAEASEVSLKQGLKRDLAVQALGSLFGFLGIYLLIFSIQLAVPNIAPDYSSGFGLAHAMVGTILLILAILAVTLDRYRAVVRLAVRLYAKRLYKWADTIASPQLRAKQLLAARLPYAIAYISIILAYLAIGSVLSSLVTLLRGVIEPTSEHPILTFLILSTERALWGGILVGILAQSFHSTLNLRRDLRAEK